MRPELKQKADGRKAQKSTAGWLTLVSFLKETRVTCLGNVLPTVGRALLHQLIIKTIPQRYDTEANPIKTTTQLRLRRL